MRFILAVDSGNTCIKWGLHNGSKWLTVGNVQHCDILMLEHAWRNLPEPSFIIVSNVAGREAEFRLSKIFKFWSSEPFWIRSSHSLCGVRNLYWNSVQLGCDRWAALIAARSFFNQSCLVINVGTAMTVDVLSDSGDFLGGIITPGPLSFLKALESNTAISNLRFGNFSKFPLCTENAIYSGAMHSLVGAVERMFKQFCESAECSDQHCIFSGGSASLLLPYIDFPVNVIENLVLEGLLIIAKEYDS